MKRFKITLGSSNYPMQDRRLKHRAGCSL